MNTIREAFATNWMFQLYVPHQLEFPLPRNSVEISLRLPAWLFVVVFPLMIFVGGCVVSIVLNVGTVFLGSILAYAGPFWIGLALLAYYWYTVYFPNVLSGLSEAIDTNKATSFDDIVQRWGERSGGRTNIFWVSLFFFVIALLSYFFVDLLWHQFPVNRFAESWVNHPQKGFFRAYFMLNHTFVLSALLSNGLVTLLGTIQGFREILQCAIKLDYYRRLRLIADLCLGIASWTMLVIISLIFASAVLYTGYAPDDSTNQQLLTATLPLGLLGTLALLAVFFLPVLYIRHAISYAKSQKLRLYERYLHEISEQIDRYTQQQIAKITQPPTVSESSSSSALPTLEKLLKDRDEIKRYIHEIELIPVLPVTWRSVLQIGITAISPTLWSVLVSGLLPPA